MSDKSKWVWMPHAGHLCVGHLCQFKLTTYVRGYIISTVGEYFPHTNYLKDFPKELRPKNKDGFETIGCNSLYETMVFKAKKGDPEYSCCPFVQGDELDLECERYNCPNEATKGHYDMCEKYDR